MRKYLKERFEVQPQELASKWSTKCWACLKQFEADQTSDLKTCSDCKRAKYCNRDCQKSDWKTHRLLHKELELTMKVLADAVTSEAAEAEASGGGLQINTHIHRI